MNNNTHPHPPPPPPPFKPNIPTKQSMGTSVGTWVAEGISLGTGSAIGRNVIYSIMKPNKIDLDSKELQIHNVKLDWCELLKDSYNTCIKDPNHESCLPIKLLMIKHGCGVPMP